MQVWWDNLSTLQHFFYFIAIPSTVILLLQTILTLVGFGFGADADFDADFDGGFNDNLDADFEFDEVSNLQDFASAGDFRFITSRGLIAFTTMFGWVGISLTKTSLPIVLTMFFALLAGLLSMFIIASLFYGISKLQANGNLNYRLAIGQEAQVYIPIPCNGKGHGKVQLMLQEHFLEIDAITHEKDMLNTGESVIIIDMLNASTLIVERLK